MKDLLAAHSALLAPYAVPHEGGLGRIHKEPTDSHRLRFQRDRDRIVHTRAFRRLKGKTQVFVDGGGGDHFRTRLTHTLEVAGISRGIARALKLNEDLAECIALAHDLGHPPFGHAGEETLDTWLKKRGSHFEHNLQSHRIVTILAAHTSQYQGLNANKEVLEGLLKHRTPHDHPTDPIPDFGPSLEAQVVNLADEIAYMAHDSEDGRKAGLFSLEDLLTVPLAAEAHANRQERNTPLRGSIIELLVTDLFQATDAALNEYNIQTIDDVYKAEHQIIRFTTNARAALDQLRSFLYQHMYLHPETLNRNQAGQAIIVALCDSYEKDPIEKLSKLEGTLPEQIRDYVSGMTDRHAINQAIERGLVDARATEQLMM